MADERKSNDGKIFEYDEQSPNGQSESDRTALEKVLKETLHQHPAKSINEQGLQSLRAVAQRYPGSDLTLEPIVVELVESILQGWLSKLANAPGFSHQMSRDIAFALYEAPVSQKRLGYLWRFLLETTQ